MVERENTIFANTGCFRVGGSRCWPRPACFRNKYSHSCATDSLRESKKSNVLLISCTDDNCFLWMWLGKQNLIDLESICYRLNKHLSHGWIFRSLASLSVKKVSEQICMFQIESCEEQQILIDDLSAVQKSAQIPIESIATSDACSVKLGNDL